MQMGKWMTAMGAVLLFGLTGCARYEPAGAFEEPVTLTETESETSAGLERNAAEESTEEGAAALTEKEPEPIAISTISRPEPVKVRWRGRGTGWTRFSVRWKGPGSTRW